MTREFVLVLVWMAVSLLGIVSQLTLFRLAATAVGVTSQHVQLRARLVARNHRFTASVRVVIFTLFEALGVAVLVHRSDAFFVSLGLVVGAAGFVLNGISELRTRQLLLRDIASELTINGTTNGGTP